MENAVCLPTLSLAISEFLADSVSDLGKLDGPTWNVNTDIKLVAEAAKIHGEF